MLSNQRGLAYPSEGLASSLQGFFQTVVFALISGVVARWVYRSGLKHAVGLLLLAALSWGTYASYHALRGQAVSHSGS